MTLSITVLVMEGTGALQLVVPMMLAVFMAKIVGDAVGMGVYDLHIKIRGAPVLVSLYWQAALLLCWLIVVSLWMYLQQLCMWTIVHVDPLLVLCLQGFGNGKPLQVVCSQLIHLHISLHCAKNALTTWAVTHGICLSAECCKASHMPCTAAGGWYGVPPAHGERQAECGRADDDPDDSTGAHHAGVQAGDRAQALRPPGLPHH